MKKYRNNKWNKKIDSLLEDKTQMYLLLLLIISMRPIKTKDNKIIHQMQYKLDRLIYKMFHKIRSLPGKEEIHKIDLIKIYYYNH